MDTTPGSGVYSKVPQDDPDLLYDRSVRTRARIVDGQLVVSGWLTDESLGLAGFVRIHDMGLEITCGTGSLTIVKATAEMSKHPHGLCPLMIPSAETLVGLDISAGYLSEVRKRMGGVRGCNHLYSLAQSVGNVAALTFAARRVHADPSLGELPPVEFFTAITQQAPAIVNSCYIWREDGEVATSLGDPGASEARE